MAKPELTTLSNPVAELVKRLEDQKAVVVAKDGTVTTADNLLEKFLPDGMTLDMIKDVDRVKTEFNAAVIDVAARGMVAAAASGKVPTTVNSAGTDITQIKASIPLYGREMLVMNYVHEAQRVDIKGERDKNGQLPRYTSYGELDVTLRTPASNKKGGDLKRVLGNIKALAEASASKK